MTFAQTILHVSIWIALAVLAVAFLLTVWRVVKGPTLPDRVVALDMLVGIVIGFIALIAIRTGFTLYIDIAIALGLVGFLATVAFARFILASAVEKPEGVSEAKPEVMGTARKGKSRKASPKAAAKSAGKITGKSNEKLASKTADKTVPKSGTKTPGKSARATRSPKPRKGE
ncbi:cation:proton antiporter [Rhizobium wenxiniae]|uniref:cation:proton antiporter n=1 Tax=Rhizobium wenxiniae TaxID=1737357 RepID=UPI003C13F66C